MQRIRPSDSASERTAPQHRAIVAEIALVFLVFFVHAGWPVPERNETHYLGKAKHYWQPDWCRGDFFLETADAHQVFYWTVGWLTLLVPLPAVAWIGRVATWGLMAWAWHRLSFRVIPRPLAAVLSAGLFVLLTERCNLAGEWVVGSVEAKGFSYVLVLLALDAMLGDRWNRAWLLLGAASAFHVLVGGWSILAMGFVWLMSGKERPPFGRMLPGLGGAVLLSLIGLVPALWLTWGVDPAVVDEANQIYVFKRLAHHLALHVLGDRELASRLIRSGLVLGAFGVLVYFTAPDARVRRLNYFVLATVLFAVCGCAISFATQDFPAIGAKLLRYYWYRLYDFALPLGVSLLGMLWIARLLQARPRIGAWALAIALAACVWHLGEVSYRRHVNPTPLADLNMHYAADWKDVCLWIADHTRPDARFLTPRLSHTFKWYAGRPEVVTRKDIPQNAQGIVEWWRRNHDVYRSRRDEEYYYAPTLADHGEPVLEQLGAKYGADYIVTSAVPPLRLTRVYRNNSYAVYRIEEKETRMSDAGD